MKEIDTRSGIAQRDALTNWRKNKAVKKIKSRGLQVTERKKTQKLKITI